MNRKKAFYIILIIICFASGIFVIGALLLASFVMTGKRQTLDEAMDWQKEHYDVSFYDNVEKTDYTVNGYKDYLLHVQLLKNPEGSTKYVILSHGYTDNRMGSLKYAGMYLDLGFNCIIYDLRGHGLNESTYTTYGILESQDLLKLIEDTRTRYSDLSELCLHGESLGAATTITALKYHPQVDFVIADCGFSDLENVLRMGYKNAHVPAFLVDVTDIGTRLRYHYSIKDMRPVDSLDENEIPVLFIHGGNDDFIIPKNSEDMYERTRGRKKIRIINGAGHAESILTDPQAYRTTVEEFIETERKQHGS